LVCVWLERHAATVCPRRGNRNWRNPYGFGTVPLIHPDGTGRKKITHLRKGTLVGGYSFSPDGKSIVFAKGPDGSRVHVYVMRLNGSHMRRVTRSKLWDSAPDWGRVDARPWVTRPEVCETLHP
jgi:hypothetical protein